MKKWFKLKNYALYIMLNFFFISSFNFLTCFKIEKQPCSTKHRPIKENDFLLFGEKLRSSRVTSKGGWG